MNFNHITGFEIDWRIKPRAGTRRRSRDNDITRHQGGERGDIFNLAADGKNHAAGAIILTQLPVYSGGDANIVQLRSLRQKAPTTGP